ACLACCVAARNDFPRCLSALFAGAAVCEADLALVRRLGRGVGGLSRVFSVGVVAWIPVRGRDHAAAGAKTAIAVAHCAVASEPGVFADCGAPGLAPDSG